MADFAQVFDLRWVDQPVDNRKAVVMEPGSKIGLHWSLDDEFTDREAMRMAAGFSIFVFSRAALLFDTLRWLPSAATRTIFLYPPATPHGAARASHVDGRS
ncbi:hypothetical protein KDW63_24255 [Burkholderia cenocepacia]|uniref:hypothetical protein n=1 Tax=Burkholderia cenocepacia TaxID=95486 RepID=UPI001B980E5A|nr:hypothetical protein [Burkholderia cenocepacia]MBR8297304.1 hypothetical protein [Burkholderia cenocepacia]